MMRPQLLPSSSSVAAARHLSFSDALERMKDSSGHCSCLELVSVTEHVALSPRHIASHEQFNCALKTTLDAKLHKYSPKYGGLPVAYDNVTLLDSTGRMLAAFPSVYFHVKVDFIVFHPQVGSYVSGIVNKISFKHLGVLVHGIFNAAIEVPHKGRKSSVQEGQEIVFEVTEINAMHGLPIIKGKLVKDIARDPKVDEDTSKGLSSSSVASEPAVVQSKNQDREKSSSRLGVEFESNNSLIENNSSLLNKSSSEKRKKKKRTNSEFSPVSGKSNDETKQEEINDNTNEIVKSKKKHKHSRKHEQNGSDGEPVSGQLLGGEVSGGKKKRKNSSLFSAGDQNITVEVKSDEIVGSRIKLEHVKSEPCDKADDHVNDSCKDSSFRKKKKKKRHSSEEINAGKEDTTVPGFGVNFDESFGSHKKKHRHSIKIEPLDNDNSLLSNSSVIFDSQKVKKKRHLHSVTVSGQSSLETGSDHYDVSKFSESENSSAKKKKKRKSNHEVGI